MESVAEFFERYLDAWNDPVRLSAFYAEPFIAARMGAVRLNARTADTQRFFEEVLAKYREKGFSRAKQLSLDVVTLGVNSEFATVRWAYLGANEDALWEWVFSYNLYKLPDGRKILLQTLHDT